MAYSKKTKAIAVRIPEKTKKLIEIEGDKNTRSYQDEILVLIAEALHQRNFNIKNFT